jgi:hypothetical protein
MKFRFPGYNEQQFNEARREVFTNGEDRELYLHIGYFNMWFAGCEIRLTLLLAKCTRTIDLEAFDLLTRGMDADTKIERLRRACEKFKPIGPNLHLRLNIFQNHMVPLRNKLAHTYPVGDYQRDLVVFTTLPKIPKRNQGPHPDEETISFFELFEYGAWLAHFNKDLNPISQIVAHPEMIEIENPQSPLLPGQDQQPNQRATAAVLGKRNRKRVRKGLPPRGKGGP